jgi:hypothetical protein
MHRKRPRRKREKVNDRCGIEEVCNRTSNVARRSTTPATRTCCGTVIKDKESAWKKQSNFQECFDALSSSFSTFVAAQIIPLISLLALPVQKHKY